MHKVAIEDHLEILITRDRRLDPLYGLDARSGHARYPVKLLRYLFMAVFLEEECIRLGRPLRVCEIGVDRGQMLLFARHYFSEKYGSSELSSYVNRWDAISARIHEPVLRACGYDSWTQANVEKPGFSPPHHYDVVILCHLLEHLHEPEKVVCSVARCLNKGGSVIGGMPVTPHWISGYWQKRIRARASRFGHVSVFSPVRIRKMAEVSGLKSDVVSGAFFMRKTGSTLENIKYWAAANLKFGRHFPAWPGEIYWRMRRVTEILTAPMLIFAGFEAM